MAEDRPRPVDREALVAELRRIIDTSLDEAGRAGGDLSRVHDLVQQSVQEFAALLARAGADPGEAASAAEDALKERRAQAPAVGRRRRRRRADAAEGRRDGSTDE